jgi:3-oxoacyl-[acyl-carrier-protein] synthase-1
MKRLFIAKHSCVTNRSARVDGKVVPVTVQDEKFLPALYRSLKIDYHRFFKMDNLSKLGFLASELIFGGDENRFAPKEDLAVICFNRSSSLDADVTYQATIRDAGNYYPSPSVFVYTLPNIVTGEIAIRNKFFGETAFYICEKFDAGQLFRATQDTFQDETFHSALVAWIEYFEEDCRAFMMLVESGRKTETPFSEAQIETIYQLYNK